MKKLQVNTLLILLSLTAIETSTAALKYAKTGCNDTCGAVRIPYPFGIGANCSFNEWYTVDCNSSTPYLSQLNQLQVLGVDLENQTVTVNMPMTSDCSRTDSIDLGTSPFLFSKAKNKFVFEGCGNAAMIDNGSVVTGCSNYCLNDTVSERNNNCFGVNCCQTTIPHHLKSYSMNLTGVEMLKGDRACRSALLVDKDSYLEVRFTIRDDNSYVPVSLLWTLSVTDSSEKETCCNWPEIVEVDLGNGTSMDSWKCLSITFQNTKSEGNPYLTDGCAKPEECARCENGRGNCRYDPIYGVDGILTRRNFTCESNNNIIAYDHESKSYLGVILGVSITTGVLFLVATIYVSYKVLKKRKEMRQRKWFFKRNGGLLLKQQEEADPSLVDKTILFTSRELEKATDNFSDNRILGRGGQGTVYKGMLVDGRIVAVKKSKIIDESQLEQFINEVVILSQVNHRNVVKLLGCCLETDVPLLVSEFVPNGTLYDLLHKRNGEFPFSLNLRLQIATEVA